MRAIEFIIEGYPEALAEFSREADPSEVRYVIDQYRQLVNKNQFRNPREKNIDYWRPKGWTAFSQMVKLKSSDITNSQRKRGNVIGNAITLQDDANWTVVIPLDKEASVHYGRGTEWCTTKPFQSYFENYFYRDEITLIYAIPKNKENDSHVAISIKPSGTVQMFNRDDDSINAQQYTQISGLDPNKFIAMSNESANQQQMESQREKYNQVLADTTQLLQESPLDPDAIERALKFTKNPEDCYNYIIAYGQEQNAKVTVHESILIAALSNVAVAVDDDVVVPDEDDKLGNYIDITKINQSTFKSLLREYPNTVIVNFPDLSANQISVVATKPNTAIAYAEYSLGGNPFPEGEPAIATDTELSIDYALIIGKPFPAGEAAIAKYAFYSTKYAVEVLGKKPFPAGEPVIANNDTYRSYYTQNILKFHRSLSWENIIKDDPAKSYEYAMILQQPFPAGEPAIAKDRHYKNEYIKNIISKYPSDTWKEATNTLQELPDNIDKNNPEDVMSYVFSVLEAVPAAEPIIATHPDYAFAYATVVTKRRFPAGEKAIASDPEIARIYDKRFGTNLAQQ